VGKKKKKKGGSKTLLQMGLNEGQLGQHKKKKAERGAIAEVGFS